METGRSDWIRVSLIKVAGQAYVPTIEVIGHTAVAVSPIPLSVGTPNSPIESAYGTEYDAFAVAYLAASSFDVDASVPVEQSLEMPRIVWNWNITPKNDGPQKVNLTMQVVWKPKGGGQGHERDILQKPYTLDILVETPPIAMGQLNILTLISGLMGSALSIPWIYERVKAMNEEQKTRTRRKNGTRKKK